jgi:error-prone DNA polymerase
MVHPYVRRRNGIGKVSYPSPSPGMAMRMNYAGFCTRRSACRCFRNRRCGSPSSGKIHLRGQRPAAFDGDLSTSAPSGKFEDKMISNNIARSYASGSPERFEQIKGVRQLRLSGKCTRRALPSSSSWLKHYRPDAFCCGLLNSQPMGFTPLRRSSATPAKNGVECADRRVLQFCQAAGGERKMCAVRLGFRQIDGFHWVDPDEEGLKKFRRRSGMAVLMKPKTGSTASSPHARRPFASLEEFARDTALPKRADPAGGCRRVPSIGLDRRAAWAVRRLPTMCRCRCLKQPWRRQPDEQAQPLPLMRCRNRWSPIIQTIRLSLRATDGILRAMLPGRVVPLRTYRAS